MGPFKPASYRISLEPDLRAFTFRGRVTVAGAMESAGREVLLNAAELDVKRCVVAGRGDPEPCGVTFREAEQLLVITLPRETEGRLALTIDFDGILNDRMAGFYRSRYRHDGGDRWIAVTQFEENDARRAFPCQDHPARKAVFDVELIVDSDLMAVSNQPVLSEEPSGQGKKKVTFARTPLMSTYLLFFGVGAFEAATDGSDPRVRALTVPGQIGQAGYGLEFGRVALRYCESYFRTPYPLAKLDLLAVPDFAFGAMENWGAITFRENLLLRAPGITSRSEEQRICEVVAHEIAHQWFGDLVSPSDWKYLWLNESFATLFGYRVVDHAHPDWGVWEQFLAGSAEGALGRDGYGDTPAIEIAGTEPVVINASNAPILYSKGACILRQIEGYIGGDGFRSGLALYLRDHAFGNAGSRDLWAAFETASSKPVTAMMESWIAQPGYPLVTVEGEGRELVLGQRRFSYLPASGSQRWVVPVNILLFARDGSERLLQTLLTEETQRVRLDEEPWACKVNAGQTGFYRVRYGRGGNLERLESLVEAKTLRPEDRWGLQNDVFALVRSGEVDLAEYLRHLRAYRGEDAYLPVSSIAENLFHAFLVAREEARGGIARAGLALLERVLGATGMEPREGEPLTTSLLRSRAMLPAALFGSAEVAAFAADRLERMLRGETVPADIRLAVMQVGAWASGPRALPPLLDLFRSSGSEQERLNVLHALGWLQARGDLEQVLDFALKEVPGRNKYVPIVSAAGNPRAADWMWGWYRGRLEELEKLHRVHHERVIASVVPLAGMSRAEEVEGFFRGYLRDKPELRDVVRLSLERMKVNLRLRERS